MAWVCGSVRTATKSKAASPGCSTLAGNSSNTAAWPTKLSGGFYQLFTKFLAMFTNYSIAVILRDYADRNGLHAIEMRVTINRAIKRLGLQIKVLPSQFVAGKVVQHPECSALNMLINKEVGRANDILLRARLSGQPLTIAAFMVQYDNPLSKSQVLPTLTSIAEALRPAVVPGTFTSYMQCLNKLREFASSLTFNELSPVWLQQFELWLMAQGLSTNTISKHHKVLKMLLSQAVNRKIIFANPYNEYKYARVKGNRQALTGKDVQRLSYLFNKHELPDHLQQTLRAFLFACATGLRLSDVVQLQHHHISGGNLVLVPQKTKRYKTKVSIPLGPNMLGLIDTTSGRVFRCATYGQQLNTNLKRIKVEAGIKAPLTFHVARHTFATLYLERGGKPEVLMQTMGITKWETVQIYIHIVEERQREALPALDALFK